MLTVVLTTWARLQPGWEPGASGGLVAWGVHPLGSALVTRRRPSHIPACPFSGFPRWPAMAGRRGGSHWSLVLCSLSSQVLRQHLLWLRAGPDAEPGQTPSLFVGGMGLWGSPTLGEGQAVLGPGQSRDAFLRRLVECPGASVAVTRPAGQGQLTGPGGTGWTQMPMGHLRSHWGLVGGGWAGQLTRGGKRMKRGQLLGRVGGGGAVGYRAEGQRRGVSRSPRPSCSPFLPGKSCAASFAILCRQESQLGAEEKTPVQ